MPQRCNAHSSQLIIFSYNVSDKNSTEQKMALFKKAHPSNYILKSLRNTILCESPFSLCFFRRQKSNAIRDSEPFYLPFINEIAVFSCHLKIRLSKSGISPLHHENQYLRKQSTIYSMCNVHVYILKNPSNVWKWIIEIIIETFVALKLNLYLQINHFQFRIRIFCLNIRTKPYNNNHRSLFPYLMFKRPINSETNKNMSLICLLHLHVISLIRLLL